MIVLALPPARAAELRLGPASLSIVGQDSLTFRTQSVFGGEVSRSAYQWDNYALSGAFEHRTDLVVHGLLLPGLRIDAAIARGPYTPGRQRLTFSYDGGDTAVRWGDIAVAFDGRLAEFRRSMRGIQVDSKLRRGALSLIASQSKPAVRTDALYGRNSAGPYYLAATPVVDASEVVEVDGRVMQRGSDYSIDYQIGLLQFAPSLIIPPTSQVTVSYEYDAPGGMSGKLIGLRAAYPVARGVSLGATYLTLGRQAAASATSVTREDRWLGNNSTGPFMLTYRPIEPGSERLRLDGILQVQGRDYRIDYTTGTIVFLEPVPAGVSIMVSYNVPAPAQAGGRERSLLALDAHYAGDGRLTLDAEVARSQGAPQGLRAAGTAVALGARGQWDRFTLGANLCSSSASFTPFESAGYKQIRSGYDWDLGFTPVEGLAISASTRDYRRPYFQYDGASNLLVRDRSRELKLDFKRAGWPSLSYSGYWSALAGGGDEPLSENSGTHLLSLGYEGKVYGVKATLRRNSYSRQGEAPAASDYGSYYTSSAFGQTDSTEVYAGAGSGSALSLWYRPGSALSVTCDLARSGTTLSGGSRSNARSERIAVEYAPGAKTSISFGYRASSTGASVSADGSSLPDSVSRSQVISLRHNPARNLSLNLAYDTQLSQGGYGTDSRSSAWGTGFWWQAGPALALIGQYTRQNLAYLGASGASTNGIASLGATVGPLGPGIKLDLSYSRMSGAASGGFNTSTYDLYQTGTSSGGAEYDSLAAHGMANLSLRARLSYALGARQEAFTEWERSSNSGYPGGNTRRSLALGWQIRLAQGLSFTLDWRRIASDSADSRYSYHAQTMTGELGVKF